MKFLHAILEVADLERSLAFYRDLIGMPVLKQFTNKMGDCIAMLGQPDEPSVELLCKHRTPELLPDRGMAVSFQVEDAEDIIEKCGRPFEGPVTLGPDRRFYFTTDPDGYRVQLQEIR